MDSFTRNAPLGFTQVTGLSAAKGLNPPNGATFAVIIPATQAVRFRDDGTAPTGAIGMPIAVGQEFIYSGNLSAIQFIEQAASAEVNVAFYRSAG